MRLRISKKLIARHRDTDNATILRGLAATSVVIVHFDGFGLRTLFHDNSYLNILVNSFISLGLYGPPVFFVASGFALSASMANKETNLVAFFVQRFFRLWPLYAVVLSLDLTYKFFSEKINSDSIINTFMHLTFLDVFNPKYFYNDPIGVLSSIPIEF